MIVKILLSIITGISLTSLLITGALLLVYCVNTLLIIYKDV